MPEIVHYFIFQKFYEELKRGDWTQKRDRTAHLIRQHFKGDFDCKKSNEDNIRSLYLYKR